MELEQNLDAYRVLAELLVRSRDLLLRALRDRHGKDWHRKPPFRSVVDRLVERKEREKAIDWYNSEYQELIHYASFEDILELLEADPNLAGPIRRLVPSPALLHARLLELEALREKLAMAREITESELGFLVTFHQRFLDLVERGEEERASEPVPAPPEEEVEERPESEDAANECPEPEPARHAGADAEDAAERDEHEGAGAGTQPVTTAGPAGGPKGIKVRGAPRPGTPAATAAAPAEVRPAEARPLAEALEERDDTTVLRALYREVTAIADELFTAEVLPHPVVWDAVREHAWYQEKIGPLGLRPLSDFYRIVEQVGELRADGASDRDVQSFLKEKNFAKLLLELRDMFQRNRV